MLGLRKKPERDALLAIQGGYYVLTGLWSLLSIGTFQRVTGPKTDTWLVKTVGSLVLVAGLVMAATGLRRRRAPEVEALAAGLAFALMVVDWVYVAQGRIARVYLLDYLAESALLAYLGARALSRQ